MMIFQPYPPACGVAVFGPDLPARCGHQAPADTGDPGAHAHQAAQAFIIPRLADMSQPVLHHDPQATPETGLVKNAVHGQDTAPVMCPCRKAAYIEAFL